MLLMGRTRDIQRQIMRITLPSLPRCSNKLLEGQENPQDLPVHAGNRPMRSFTRIHELDLPADLTAASRQRVSDCLWGFVFLRRSFTARPTPVPLATGIGGALGIRFTAGNIRRWERRDTRQ
jgi:hypothetical protein